MRKERVILTSFKRTRDERLLREYGHMLEGQGWTLSIMEGGYLSPNRATLFIFGRSPYHGQLLQFRADKEAEHCTLVQELIASGDFVKY